jgi:hypothetical protein
MTTMQTGFNAKVKAIKEAIELEVTQDDLEGLQGKLLKCATLFSLSAEMCARSTVDLRNAELKALQELGESTGIQAKLKAMTGEEQGRAELADRLNAGLTHTIEALRTMISLKKTEYEKTYGQ